MIPLEKQINKFFDNFFYIKMNHLFVAASRIHQVFLTTIFWWHEIYSHYQLNSPFNRLSQIMHHIMKTWSNSFNVFLGWYLFIALAFVFDILIIISTCNLFEKDSLFFHCHWLDFFTDLGIWLIVTHTNHTRHFLIMVCFFSFHFFQVPLSMLIRVDRGF